MDNSKEIAEIIRRASLASVTKPKKYEEAARKDAPKDIFNLVHALSLCFGMLNILPLTFFITANGYWMYKFRDPVTDTVDLNNKTTLQKYFVSGSMVVQTVPSIITMLLSTIFGPKFKAHSRIVLSLTLICVTFILFTAFIKVNTDTWQLGFFILTLMGLSLLTGIVNLFQVSSMAVIPKFPPAYMKTFLFGQGMAPIFSATLQIVSLTLGSSTETSALFYFISGAFIIFISLVLYLTIRHTAFYKYYIQIELEDTKKKHSKEEIKTTFIQMWPCLAVLITVFLTMNITHPCITSLVVSENYGNGNKWNDVYFVPTITFLFGEVCSQLGRLLPGPILTRSNGHWVVGLVAIRIIILAPLILLSNAQPRNHLPVLLTHDWQYILLCFVYFVSSGFILNAAILSIPKLAERQDVAYLLLLSTIGVAVGVFSPLSLLAVRIL